MLSLELRHGDLIVMHGGDLQKYFEVCHISDPGLSEWFGWLTNSARGWAWSWSALRSDGTLHSHCEWGGSLERRFGAPWRSDLRWAVIETDTTPQFTELAGLPVWVSRCCASIPARNAGLLFNLPSCSVEGGMAEWPFIGRPFSINGYE